MKKFLLVLLLLISLLCLPYYNNDYIDINHMINVSSLGIDYQDNQFNIYAYVISNYSMSKSDYNTSNDSNVSTIITSKGSTIENALFNLYDSVFVKLNFSHIQTLVLQKNFISNTNIFELIDFISNHQDFYPKFNVFVTSEKIKDIYNIDFFSDTSSYYNILTEYKSEIEHKSTSFIDLINDFYEPNYFMLYPSLKINTNIIRTKEGSSLYIDGYYFFENGMLNKITYKDNPLLYLLYSTNDISLLINNTFYFLYSYSLRTLKINNKLFVIFYSKSNYPLMLKNIVKNNLINLYNQSIDVYNLKYFDIDINNVNVISVEKTIKKSL